MDMQIAQAQFTENVEKLIAAMQSLGLSYTRGLGIVSLITVRLRLLLQKSSPQSAAWAGTWVGS